MKRRLSIGMRTTLGGGKFFPPLMSMGMAPPSGWPKFPDLCFSVKSFCGGMGLTKLITGQLTYVRLH